MKENPFADPIHPFSDLTCRDLPKSGLYVSTYGRLLLLTSLFYCPSIIAQALRAAIVAAELPLRGKLRAQAKTFFIDQRILEVIYQCLRALFIHGSILCWRPRIDPCSAHGASYIFKPRVFCWVRVFDLESGGARCARRARRPYTHAHRTLRRFAPVRSH